MSDTPTEQDDLKARIAAVEASLMSRYYGVEREAKGWAGKANAAWQWMHGEMYHWTSHAKEIAYALAALGVFLLCVKMAGIVV